MRRMLSHEQGYGAHVSSLINTFDVDKGYNYFSRNCSRPSTPFNFFTRGAATHTAQRGARRVDI